jgi:hypothetical protein
MQLTTTTDRSRRSVYTTTSVLVGLVVFFAIHVAPKASAQEWTPNFRGADSSGARARTGGEWLEDRNRIEGAGIRTGNLELHPGIGAEAGWDSNIFYDDENRVSSALLRVTPHLMLSTLGAERSTAGVDPNRTPSVVFRGGLAASFIHFFADNVRDSVQGDAGFNLHLAPSRPVSLVVFDNLGHSIRPFTENPTGGKLDYARTNNTAGLTTIFSSRSKVLEASLGYQFGIDYFHGQEFQFNNNLAHTGIVGGTWRFFPFTAAVYRGEFIGQNYTDPSLTPTALVSDNFRMNNQVGLNGAITPRLSATVLAGYSAGFYQLGDDFDGVIGTAELRWAFRETAHVGAGYNRSYNTSFIGNFFLLNEGYVTADAMFGGVFHLRGRVGLGTQGYGLVLAPDATNLVGNMPYRDDLRAIASVFGEYRATNWLAFNGTFTYTGVFTDFEYLSDQGTGAPFVDPAQFNKMEAWAGARIFY